MVCLILSDPNAGLFGQGCDIPLALQIVCALEYHCQYKSGSFKKMYIYGVIPILPLLKLSCVLSFLFYLICLLLLNMLIPSFKYISKIVCILFLSSFVYIRSANIYLMNNRKTKDLNPHDMKTLYIEL